MSQKKFEELIEGLCRTYKLDHTRVLAGDSLDLDGVRIALRRAEGPLASTIMMYCDFGPVPKEFEAQAYRQLLEINLSTYIDPDEPFAGQGEIFCMTQEGRVVLVNCHSLEALTPESLAGYLGVAAMHAKRWREDFFLSKRDENTKKKTRANSLPPSFAQSPTR